MKVMIDTNIIISAALFPKGRAAQAFFKSLFLFREKFPDRLTELEAFLFNTLSHIHVVPTPDDVLAIESAVRDPKDRPILRSALDVHADLFLTGDKDFLDSAITDPRIISVADFLEM